MLLLKPYNVIIFFLINYLVGYIKNLSYVYVLVNFGFM